MACKNGQFHQFDDAIVYFFVFFFGFHVGAAILAKLRQPA